MPGGNAYGPRTKVVIDAAWEGFGVLSDLLSEMYTKDLVTNHDPLPPPSPLPSRLPDSAPGRVVLGSAARLLCSVNDPILSSR